MNALERYRRWLTLVPEGDPLYAELQGISGDDAAIRDRFYKEIEFGTAGLRGICGAGTNRMNRYTVGRATSGIANYIRKAGGGDRGVVIAYDCRYHSKEFSELAARILAANGILVYLFPSLRPTPELSFAIRRLRAVSGINMTASHNPKEYNGYKVYWSDGAQISGSVSDGMQKEINALDFFDHFPAENLEEAVKTGKIVMLGEKMDREYLDYVLSMAKRGPEELDLSVPSVYTPLNGAGFQPVQSILRERGFTDIHIVPEQADPDPEFTTVGYPNPEDPKTFALAEKLGKETGAAVLIATDPDSDRMAIEIPDGKGGFRFLNGNQTGAMLIAYMAESMKKAGTLPKKAAMIKSIVTGDFGAAICRAYGIRVFEALTGFKNICGRIPEIEKAGYSYFFAYEESIGCAPGEQVRDKDGVCASMLVAEMAAYFRKKGITMRDALHHLYETYGFFAERQISIVLKGEAGEKKIRAIMDRFRKESPAEFAGIRVEKKIDYLNGYEDIPASNVLKFILEDGSWFAVRPSGTEPKLKFYFYTVADSEERAGALADRIAAAVTGYAGNE